MSDHSPNMMVSAWLGLTQSPISTAATHIKTEPLPDDMEDVKPCSLQNDAGNHEDQKLSIKQEEPDLDAFGVYLGDGGNLPLTGDHDIPMFDSIDHQILHETNKSCAEIAQLEEPNESATQSCEVPKEQLLGQISHFRDDIKHLKEQNESATQLWEAEKEQLLGQLSQHRDENKRLKEQNESATQLWKAQREKFLGIISHFKDENKRLKEQHQSLRKLRKKNKEKLSSIMKENEKNAAEVRSVRAELKETGETYAKAVKDLEKKSDEIRILWQQAVAELSQRSITEKVFSVDDDTITSKWKSLGYSIRNLTTQHFKNHVGQLSPDDIQRFLKLSINYLSYLREWNQSHIFFRSVIWHFLDEHLFCKPSQVWGAATCAGIEDIRRSILVRSEDDRSKFLAWRAQTGILLHDLSSTQKTHFLLAQKLMLQISPYTNSGGWKDVETMVFEICRKAVELASIFARSRARYCARLQQSGPGGKKLLYGFKYCESIMEILHHHKHNGRVTLVESPSLHKSGDSKGRNEQEQTLLVKMRVCC